MTGIKTAVFPDIKIAEREFTMAERNTIHLEITGPHSERFCCLREKRRTVRPLELGAVYQSFPELFVQKF